MVLVGFASLRGVGAFLCRTSCRRREIVLTPEIRRDLIGVRGHLLSTTAGENILATPLLPCSFLCWALVQFVLVRPDALDASHSSV